MTNKREQSTRKRSYYENEANSQQYAGSTNSCVQRAMTSVETRRESPTKNHHQIPIRSSSYNEIRRTPDHQSHMANRQSASKRPREPSIESQDLVVSGHRRIMSNFDSSVLDVQDIGSAQDLRDEISKARVLSWEAYMELLSKLAPRQNHIHKNDLFHIMGSWKPRRTLILCLEAMGYRVTNQEHRSGVIFFLPDGSAATEKTIHGFFYLLLHSFANGIINPWEMGDFYERLANIDNALRHHITSVCVEG